MVDMIVICGVSRRALLFLIGFFLSFAKIAGDFYLHKQQQQQENTIQAYSDAIINSMTNNIHLFNSNNDNAEKERTRLRRVEDDKNSNLPNKSSHSSIRKYAYAFVIAGCNPDKPNYKGFVYNILVATRILREMGSTADVIAFFQLSYDYTGRDELAKEDVLALEAMNVYIKYIPRNKHENFYETVMNKFRILNLTEYNRVLLMDGDVIPIANLDYLFELSDDNKYGPGNSTLKENVIVSGPWEPSNAGFFMLTPGEGEYEHIKTIIDAREERSRQEDNLFNEVTGWGHVIQEGDEWHSRKESGRNWTFHFAFSDQGLLYHWTKYVKKSVSIVYHGYVENWGANASGVTVLEQTLEKPFDEYSKPIKRFPSNCAKFMCDYVHLSGTRKPWLRKPPIHLGDDVTQLNDVEIWWYYLKKVDQEIGMHLDFEHWETGKRPLLGLYASWNDIRQTLAKNKE